MGGKKSDPGAAQREAALAMGEKAAQQYQGLTIPDIQSMKLELEAPELVGILTPEEYAASEMGKISTDPRLRDAQMSALAGLQEAGKVGYNPQQQLLLRQSLQQAAGTAEAGRKAAMSEQAQRGLTSSGQGLLSALNAGQNASNLQSNQAAQIAADAANARASALTQAGQLGGQMESQQFDEDSKKAAAQDAINAMNTKTKMDVAAQNLAQRQRIAEVGTEQRNQQQQYNKQLSQTDFSNQYQLAAGKAGAYGGQANMLMNSALPSTIKGNPAGGALAGAGSGAAVGAAVGNVPGAAIGAAVGGLAGYMGSKADGGVIKNTNQQQLNNASSNNFKGTFADGGIYNGEPASEQSTQDVRNLVKKEIHYENGGVSKEIYKYSGLDKTCPEQLKGASSDDFSGSFAKGGISRNRLNSLFKFANGGGVPVPEPKAPKAPEAPKTPDSQSGGGGSSGSGSSGASVAAGIGGAASLLNMYLQSQEDNSVAAPVRMPQVNVPQMKKDVLPENVARNGKVLHCENGEENVQDPNRFPEQKIDYVNQSENMRIADEQRMAIDAQKQADIAEQNRILSETQAMGKEISDKSPIEIAKLAEERGFKPETDADKAYIEKLKSADEKDRERKTQMYSKAFGGIGEMGKIFFNRNAEKEEKRPAFAPVNYTPHQYTPAQLPQLGRKRYQDGGTAEIEMTPEMKLFLAKKYGNIDAAPYINPEDRGFLENLRQNAGPVKFYDRNHEKYIEKKDGKIFTQDPVTGETQEISLDETGPVKFTQEQLLNAARKTKSPQYPRLLEQQKESAYKKWATEQAEAEKQQAFVDEAAQLVGDVGQDLKRKALQKLRGYADGGIAEKDLGKFSDKQTDGNNFLDSGLVSNYNDLYTGLSSSESNYFQDGIDDEHEKTGMSFANGGPVCAADGEFKFKRINTVGKARADEDLLAKRVQLQNQKDLIARKISKGMPVGDSLYFALDKTQDELAKLEGKGIEAPVNVKSTKINVPAEVPGSVKAPPVNTGNMAFDAREAAAALEAEETAAKAAAKSAAIKNIAKTGAKGLAALGIGARVLGGPEAMAAQEMLGSEDVGAGSDVVSPGPDYNEQQRLARQVPQPKIMPSLQNYDMGGVQNGKSYVGDKVPAQINSGEMVNNIAQQQRAKDALNGEKHKPYVGNRVDEKINKGEAELNEKAQDQLFAFLSGKTNQPPKEDIVEPVEEQKNARRKALEAMRK